MDLDLSCVSSFLVLIEEQHFGRAALRLNLTSSALTKRVQRLERQLDAVLVERGHSGMLAVTPAGRRFTGQARALLAQAVLTREAAARTVQVASACVVRLGVPGTIGEYPQRFELEAIGRHLRDIAPDARLRCYGIPYSALTASLIARHTDVIWTASEVPNSDVESIPLAVLRRTGVVPAGHHLAEAGVSSVGSFVELPMIYNPVLPVEWMSQWYLGDVRPAADARLVESSAQDALTVLRDVADGFGVTVVPAPFTHRLGTRLRPIFLTDVPPIVFHAAYRRVDRRGPVLALIYALKLAAAVSSRAGFPDRADVGLLVGSGTATDLPEAMAERSRRLLS